MNTTSTGSERPPRRRLGQSIGLRVWLALVFGTLAGVLCVLLSLAIGHRASEVARVETGRYLARLAAEYRDKLAERSAAATRGELSRARALRDAMEASADPALPVELMLVGRDGTVLVGPQALEGARVAAPVSPAATALQRWPDGVRYIASVADGPGRAGGAWSTLARSRADLALAPVAQLQRAMLWAGLLLALVGMTGGWVLATRHVRPLEVLTQAALEIAAGNDRTELPPLDDYPEVSRLADALRTMLSRLRAQSESLRSAQDRLQLRVHERTAELVKLQAQLELEVADARIARDDLARAWSRAGTGHDKENEHGPKIGEAIAGAVADRCSERVHGS